MFLWTKKMGIFKNKFYGVFMEKIFKKINKNYGF